MVIKNKNRTVMVYVYDGNVDISTFLVDKQGGCYDYISCRTPEACTDEDVFCLLDILEDIFFPLLEKPGKELKEVVQESETVSVYKTPGHHGFRDTGPDPCNLIYRKGSVPAWRKHVPAQ